jgi:hypothetical protein
MKDCRWLLLALVVFCPAAGQAASPWLPGTGSGKMTFSYVNESFQDFWAGRNRERLPTNLRQNTVWGNLEWGLSDNLALDLAAGFTKATFGENSLDGLTDSSIGLRYKALQQDRWVLTFRGAANLHGSYRLTDQGPYAPGDRAHGVEGSTLVGMLFGHGVFAFGESGLRYRQKPVPNDFFASAGVGHSVRGFTYGTSYGRVQSLSGLDIGGPGFSPSRFRELKEIVNILDSHAGYTTSRGHYFGFSYARSLAGRNTGAKRILGITVGLTF